MRHCTKKEINDLVAARQAAAVAPLEEAEALQDLRTLEWDEFKATLRNVRPQPRYDPNRNKQKHPKERLYNYDQLLKFAGGKRTKQKGKDRPKNPGRPGANPKGGITKDCSKCIAAGRRPGPWTKHKPEDCDPAELEKWLKIQKEGDERRKGKRKGNLWRLHN